MEGGRHDITLYGVPFEIFITAGNKSLLNIWNRLYVDLRVTFLSIKLQCNSCKHPKLSRHHFYSLVTRHFTVVSHQTTIFRPMQENPDVGIPEIFVCGIRNTAKRMQNPPNHWNPESTDKESRIQYLKSRIHGVEFRI